MCGGITSSGLKVNFLASSPDLSPIEHVWEELGRRVKENHQAPRDRHDHLRMLQVEWRRIPQRFLRTLVDSMWSRCVECLGNCGSHTHYWNWIVDLKGSCELRFRPLLCLNVCKRKTLCSNAIKFTVLTDEMLIYVCPEFHSLGMFGLENIPVYVNCA